MENGAVGQAAPEPTPAGPEAASGVAPAKEELSTSVLGTGAGISLGGRAIGSGLTALQEILLARLLGSQAFGLFALGMAFLQILIIPGSLGLQQGVVRFGSETRRTDPPKFRTILGKSIGISALSASLLGLLLFALAPWIGEVAFRKPGLVPVLRVVACTFPLAAVLRVAAAATRVSLRMKYSVLSEDILQPLSFVAVFLALYAAGYRLGGALAALFVSFGLGLLLALVFLGRLYGKQLRLPRGHIATWTLLAFSLVAAINGTITLAIGRMDRLIVGYYLPASSVGIYQAASQVAVVFTMIVGAFNVVLAPMVPDLFRRGQFERLEELYRVGARWALYVSLPVFLSIVVMREELLELVFGAEYVGGAVPMAILCLGQMVNVATGGVGFVMTMTGRQHKLLLISSVVLAASLVLYVIMTPRFGLIGAAGTTALMIAVLFSWAVLDVRRAYGLWPYDRRLVKGAVASVLCVLALWALTGSLGVESIWMLMAGGCVALGVFGGTLLALGLEPEDKEFAALALSRIRKLGKTPQG